MNPTTNNTPPVLIDPARLSTATKAEIIDTARRLSAALNSIDYMTIGNEYAEHVKRNASADLSLDPPSLARDEMERKYAEQIEQQRRTIDRQAQEIAQLEKSLKAARDKAEEYRDDTRKIAQYVNTIAPAYQR